MNISDWKITEVEGLFDKWKVTAEYASAGGESAIRTFFNSLFSGGSDNYLSLNSKDYQYVNFEVKSSTEVYLYVRRNNLDYTFFPCFMSWSTWNISDNYIWTAANPDNVISIGSGVFFNTSPFNLAGALTSWDFVSGGCSETESTASFRIGSSSGYSNSVIEKSIISLFIKNNYLYINNKQYRIADNPSQVSSGQGIITVYKKFSGERLCENITSINIIDINDYIIPAYDNVFKYLNIKESVPSENLKVFYDFKSFAENGYLKSIDPVSSGSYSGQVFGNLQEFIGFNLDQYNLAASGTGFFRSGLNGYSSPAPEVSAITYNPLKNTLFINEDDAGTTNNKYTERNLDGSWIRTITSNIQDSEGLCYMSGEYFAIASEQNTPKIYYGTINDSVSNLDTASMHVVTLDSSWGSSKGLEGIAFDKNNNCFYGTREEDPDRGIYQIDFDGTTTKLFAPIGITDFAGLHYHEGLENFFILSEQDKKVYQTDNNGSIISEKSVSPMNQPEGITFTSGMQRMYIAGEPCEGGYWEANLSGYGCFNREKYVQISNADELYSKKWTMMFACSKEDNDPSILFSNFGGYTSPSSGFAIGLNSANRLYYENYGKNFTNFEEKAQIPQIYTLISHPAGSNIYCAIGDIDNDTLSLGRYNFESMYFDFEQFPVSKDYFSPSDNWFIGTGIAQGADNYNFDGCMDYFLYFKDSITPDKLNIIASGIYSVLTGTTARRRVLTPQITGYTQSLTGIIGIIGYTGVLSGIKETIYQGYGVTGSAITSSVTAIGSQNLYITGDTYTGFYVQPPVTKTYKNLRSYTSFYDLSHSFQQEINQLHIYSGENILSVTGFNTGLSGYFYTGYQNIYTGKLLTGYLTSGYDTIALTGSVSNQLLSETGIITLPSKKVYDYFYTNASYVGSRDGDTLEFFHRNYVKNNQSYVNLSWRNNYLHESELAYSEDLQKSAFTVPFGSFSSNIGQQSGKLNLFLNGVGQHQGLLKTLNIRNDFNSKTFVTLSGDYSLVTPDLQGIVNDFASGDTSSSQFNSTVIGEDQCLLDFNEEGARERATISNTSDWSTPADIGINVENSQVFMNGVKLLSGIDYTLTVDGYINANSPLDQITGYLTTIPHLQEEDFLHKTGQSLYDITGLFLGQSILYLNGIRQPKDQVLNWSSGFALIGPVSQTVIGELKELYRK